MGTNYFADTSLINRFSFSIAQHERKPRMRHIYAPIYFFLAIALSCSLAIAAATSDANDNDQQARTYFNAGKAYLDEGNIEKAKVQFEKATSLDSRLAAETHYSLGLAYAVKNNPTRAIEELDPAIFSSITDSPFA